MEDFDKKQLALKTMQADLIENGVIHTAEQLIIALHNIVQRKELKIETIAAHSDRLNIMLDALYKARQSVDEEIAYQAKKETRNAN